MHGILVYIINHKLLVLSIGIILIILGGIFLVSYDNTGFWGRVLSFIFVTLGISILSFIYLVNVTKDSNIDVLFYKSLIMPWAVVLISLILDKVNLPYFSWLRAIIIGLFVVVLFNFYKH